MKVFAGRLQLPERKEKMYELKCIGFGDDVRKAKIHSEYEGGASQTVGYTIDDMIGTYATGLTSKVTVGDGTTLPSTWAKDKMGLMEAIGDIADIDSWAYWTDENKNFWADEITNYPSNILLEEGNNIIEQNLNQDLDSIINYITVYGTQNQNVKVYDNDSGWTPLGHSQLDMESYWCGLPFTLTAAYDRVRMDAVWFYASQNSGESVTKDISFCLLDARNSTTTTDQRANVIAEWSQTVSIPASYALIEVKFPAELYLEASKEYLFVVNRTNNASGYRFDVDVWLSGGHDTYRNNSAVGNPDTITIGSWGTWTGSLAWITKTYGARFQVYGFRTATSTQSDSTSINKYGQREGVWFDKNCGLDTDCSTKATGLVETWKDPAWAGTVKCLFDPRLKRGKWLTVNIPSMGIHYEKMRIEKVLHELPFTDITLRQRDPSPYQKINDIIRDKQVGQSGSKVRIQT